MSNDESKKVFNTKLQLVKTSFQFRSMEISEADELSSAFNNILYKVRIERYIDQLKSLLNNLLFLHPRAVISSFIMSRSIIIYAWWVKLSPGCMK